MHKPQVLCLDEPTLGLDVTTQQRLRQFISEYNRRNEATIILTSHYMADVTALCRRVILIHHGQLRFDGVLADLVSRLTPYKIIRVTLAQKRSGYVFSAPAGVEIIQGQDSGFTLRVARTEAAGLTAHLLDTLPVSDLSVEDPPIEAVIDKIFQEADL